MVLSWNPVGALGLFNALVAATLAIVIFRSRPHQLQNRRLALVLALEGAWYIGGGGILYFTDDGGAAYAAQGLTEVLYPAMVVGYLLFVATLDTPWTRPLRRRPVTLALWGLLVALPLVVIARLPLFVTGIEPASYAPWEAINGPWRQAFRRAGLVLLVVVFAAVLEAWRRAPNGTPGRQRTGIYAVAFGARLLGPFNGTVLAGLSIAAPQPFSQILFQTTIFVYYLALAYGILRHQLFDIHVKIKWTLKQSTVAAVLLATIFLVSEGAQLLFGEERAWLGLVAGGALVFALAPLQRFAEGVADRAMPGVRPLAEMSEAERVRAYRAQVEAAYADGSVDGTERRMLEAARRALDIDAETALALESELA